MRDLSFFICVACASALYVQTGNGASASVATLVDSDAGKQTVNSSCELRIFPTEGIFDSSQDFFSNPAVGWLTAAALSAVQSGGSGKLRNLAIEQMQKFFSPDAQISALKDAGVLATLRLPANTRILKGISLPTLYGGKPTDPEKAKVFINFWQANKKGTPIESVDGPCYRELIISSITISKNLGGLKLKTAFVYRVFNEQLFEKHLYDGENTVASPAHFPAVSPDQEPAAEAAMHDAFTTNFTTWVSRRVSFK